jgi:hypothetical protein
LANPPVNNEDTLPDRAKSGFKGELARKITLLPGTKIFRLDNEDAPSGTYGISGWWSLVSPYMEDTEGAKGRYEQAVLNGLDMSCMVRYMSAVKLEWNNLNNYVEVTTSCELTAFFGKFEPMALSSKDKADYINFLNLLKSRDGNYSSMSETFFGGKTRRGGLLGLLEGWQLFIPNLKNEYLADKDRRPIVIDARSKMIELGQHLKSTLKPNVRRFPRMIKAEYLLNKLGVAEVSKDSHLLKLKSCLENIDRLDPSFNPFPAPVPAVISNELRTFVVYADLICKFGTVTYNIKEQIKDYGLLAKSFLSGQEYEQVKSLLS